MFPNRMPSDEIASCQSANDAQEFRWPGGTPQVQGVRTEVIYRVANPADGATPKYISVNDANAITPIGGKLQVDPAKSTLGDRLRRRASRWMGGTPAIAVRPSGACPTIVVAFWRDGLEHI